MPDTRVVFEFEKKGDVLRIEAGSKLYRIRLWPKPMAQVSKDQGVKWEWYYPKNRVVYPPLRVRTPKASPEGTPAQQTFNFGSLYEEKPVLTHRQAFDALRKMVPRPLARALQPFERGQWNPLVFSYFESLYLDLLESTPVLAYWIANHPPAYVKIYRDYKYYLPRLVRAKQARLLYEWLGVKPSKHAVRITRKIYPQSAERIDPQDFECILPYPDVVKRFSHLEHVNATVWDLLSDSRVRDLVSQGLLEEVSGTPDDSRYGYLCYRIQDTIATLRQCVPERTLPIFKSAAQCEALWQDAQELMARTKREELERPFQPPPIPGTPDIQPLLSGLDLVEEGRQQHNCVGGSCYFRKVLAGDSYIYRVLKPERATLCLGFFQGYWYIEELKATCNKQVKESTRAEIQYWLDEHAF